MTKDEALKMAIKFMGTLTIDVGIKTWNEKHRKEAIQACKEALEQPAQEPVACMFVSEEGGCEEIGHLEHHYDGEFPDDFTPLYTHPAPSWQGLSDDEIWEYHNKTDSDNWVIDFARAIEQALKEKNHGNV